MKDQKKSTKIEEDHQVNHRLRPLLHQDLIRRLQTKKKQSKLLKKHSTNMPKKNRI
jgi:hypothetical protein